MIKKLITYITVVTLLSFVLVDNFRELVLNKLEAYVTNYPEKVYVQTDKPYYTTGEDIWYTAYLINGVNHKRSEKSRIIYVELINERDSILSKKQLYTNDVSVAGDFKIEKEWQSGNYMLRAYTNYMRNNHPDYFFQKQIPVWNISKKDSLSNIVKNLSKEHIKEEVLMERPDINFYPESGYLVNNITSKVAVKVKDKLGRNITLEGTIKDSNNDTICLFKTYKFGLSVFSLQPKADLNYYASVIINDKEFKYPLPKALANGYSLNIENQGHQLTIKASSNLPIGLKNTFLVAHQRGRVIYEKLETETINSYLIKSSTSSLFNGIANFTLFDNNGKPVCERLVYIENPNNTIAVNLKVDNETPKTREKISIQIDLKDNAGATALGNLSMSITDIDAISHNNKNENIKTYLLLNSDLRGHIKNPGYFFEKENDKKRRYLLDLTMLTHGWRRFTWNTVLYDNTKIKNHFKPEKGVYISGYTAALKGDKQRLSAASRLTFMSKLPYQEKKRTEPNGAFKYGPFVFKDSLPTLIEARVKDFKSDEERKNRFVSIFLDENFNDSPKIVRNTILNPTTSDSHTQITNFIKQAKRISDINTEFSKARTLLDEIVITAKKKTADDERKKELNERTIYGSASHRIDMNDYENQRHLSVLDLLNMLPGVSANNSSISIRNQGTPKILLDGIPVEFEEISFMSGNDIDFVDVLKGIDASFFSNSGNGVIALYSRTGNYSRNINLKRKPGIIDFTAIGFYTAREFYAPKHIDNIEEVTKQDVRTTLHWEPKIIINKDNTKAEISFFTSDRSSKYAIKIEGITNTGIPIHHLSTFEVE